MKTWVRFGLWGGAVLLAAAAAALATGHVLAERKMQRTVDVRVAAVALPTGAAAIERGRYLYASRGCADCHGADGGGRVFIDDGDFRVSGPHISPGSSSVTANYRVEDWVRSIRHGVKPGGRPAMIMPSEDYNRMSDADLGALVAYLQQMPATAGRPAVLDLPLPVRVLYAYGQIRDAAEKIDHSLPPEMAVPEGPTVEHGRYVAQMCKGCHGAELAGGKIPGGPPDWPAAADLRSGTVMARYPSAESFMRMMKSGQRPDGSKITVMPFESLAQMNDTDLRGLHVYLQSLGGQVTASHGGVRRPG
jgi:mono/diheme cytochrome c family protein